MPTEPRPWWAVDDWPCPSPEAVVRARVLSRARVIAVQRALTLVTVMLLVAAVATHGRVGDESSSRLRMVDVPGPDVAGAGGGPVVPPALPMPVSAASSAAAEAPAPDPAGAAEASSALPAGEDVPDLADPLGDAVYNGHCIHACPKLGPTPWAPESQAAIDVVSFDLHCSAESLTLEFRVRDLGAPLAPDPAGTDALVGFYGTSIRFDSRRALAVSAYHWLGDDTWTASAGVSSWTGQVPGARAWAEGSSVFVDVPMWVVDWRPGRGELAMVNGGTMAAFETVTWTHRAQADDWQGYAVPMCQ